LNTETGFEHRDTEVLMKKKTGNTEASPGSFGRKSDHQKRNMQERSPGSGVAVPVMFVILSNQSMM
jgi:hypothetical protein